MHDIDYKKQVVRWFLANGDNLSLTSREFNVSRPTLRNWVNKYKKIIQLEDSNKIVPINTEKEAAFLTEFMKEADLTIIEGLKRLQKLFKTSKDIRGISKALETIMPYLHEKKDSNNGNTPGTNPGENIKSLMNIYHQTINNQQNIITDGDKNSIPTTGSKTE